MTWYRLLLITLATVLAVGCGAPPPAPPKGGAPTQPAAATSGRAFGLEGQIDAASDGLWQIDGVVVRVDRETRLTGVATPGAWALVRGTLSPDGTRTARDVEVVGDALVVAGRLDRVEGEVWTIDGVPVRVGADTRVSVTPAPGAVVRAVVRWAPAAAGVWEPVALRITPLREAVVFGVVTSLDDDRLVLGDDEITITPDTLRDERLVVGSVVRVVVRPDDDDGSRWPLVALAVILQPAALVIEGPLERIDDDGWLVVGGRRLRFGGGAVLSRSALVVGAPLRLVVAPGTTPTILAITVVQVNVRVEVAVRNSLPLAPDAQPLVVVVQPQPQQPAPPPREQARGGGDDDDDDDDDD